MGPPQKATTKKIVCSRRLMSLYPAAPFKFCRISTGGPTGSSTENPNGKARVPDHAHFDRPCLPWPYRGRPSFGTPALRYSQLH
eukprot:7933190-Pyramimonas_sp.AAC.1